MTTLLDLGWRCSDRGARYDHESGASVELEGSATDGTLTARINGAEPVRVRSLGEALDWALGRQVEMWA